MSFTEVFGGSTIYPSQTTYLAITFSADVTLAWPIEQQVSGNVVADILDLNPTGAGLSAILPDARQVSTGYTALFNNISAQTVSIKNAAGSTLLSLTSGTVWQIYLTDNSTLGGTWRVFQYGASVSVSNAAALAGYGLKAITSTLNQTMPTTLSSTTPTTLVDADRAKAFVWTGGVGSWTLTAPATVGNDWHVHIRNGGSGNLTLTPASGQINAAANLVLGAGQSATIFTDGSNYYTISGASSSSGGFDYVTIDVSGAGDFVLSGAQLNRIAYKFIGALSGTRNIVVPNSIQQYWINNATTGAFSLYTKTVAQAPGILTLQNNQHILYCDGSNVIDAESTTVTFPISIAQGGTGSITAAAALTALGGIASTRTITAGAGLTGGGDLSSDRTLSVGAGTGITVNADDVALDTANTRNVDHSAISVIAGNGLTGGGALTGSVTLDVVAAGSGITATANSIQLDRTGLDGLQVGYMGSPHVTANSDYTFIITDRSYQYYHNSGTPHTYTIPDNGSVAFPVGTVIDIITGNGTSNLTIAITTDTLFWLPSGSTGSRTLAQNGHATIRKVQPTVWIIEGTNLT